MVELLAGKYRLDRVIGRGSFGEVWEGTYVSLGMRVAIELAEDAGTKVGGGRARYEREARTAAKLRTKHAVKVFDGGVSAAGEPYLVTEFLEATSLSRHLADGGPLTFGETVAIVTQAAHALEEAHSLGLVHRHVAPERVFLTADPDAPSSHPRLLAKVVVFDFSHGAAAPPNVASDILSLATCAFTAMTASSPFEGRSGPMVPAEFDAWFSRACAADPQRRFRSVRELAASLARAYDEFAEAARDDTTPSHACSLPGDGASTGPERAPSSRRRAG